jgi:hypothetical protein
MKLTGYFDGYYIVIKYHTIILKFTIGLNRVSDVSQKGESQEKLHIVPKTWGHAHNPQYR